MDGPDGELAASLRYLSQRFSMPTEITKATLTDVGTEELGHLEMVGTLVSQLTKGVSPEELKAAGLGEYYTDHGISVYPQSAAGNPFTASYIGVKGDPITDLHEDMAAEQKARTTYEYLIDLADDPDVIDVLKFLRQREVVHFQRFGEALRTVEEKLAERKFYMNNMPNNIWGMHNNRRDSDRRDNGCGCDRRDNDCGCDRRNNDNRDCDRRDNDNCGCDRRDNNNRGNDRRDDNDCGCNRPTKNDCGCR